MKISKKILSRYGELWKQRFGKHEFKVLGIDYTKVKNSHIYAYISETFHRYSIFIPIGNLCHAVRINNSMATPSLGKYF